jgi:serine/threonine protein kinase/Tol biopolymer transport system component
MIGTRVAHYEITAHLGTGGMGEVYQATDTKLGRKVAIKVLPEAFAQDTERLGRFEREARVLASLNHSNIAAIHGLEEIDNRHFLVMELVSGETLADRIKRGAIPIDEALPIARQIAEALEEAHEKGVIHRDLKPANIKVTPEGKVKVLDFGLAKAFETETSSPNLSQSPTISMAATNAGVILGTAGYMSPEQARGFPADMRSDVFSFGCVLYEMLAGRQPFEGDTVSEVLASVLKVEPNWTVLPNDVPPEITRLLRRCLHKDRKLRLRHIGDARIELEATFGAPPTNTKPNGISQRLWIALACTTALAITFAGMLIRQGPVSVDPTAQVNVAPAIRVPVRLPEGTSLYGMMPQFVISPDGSSLVFAATRGGERSQLWLQRFDLSEAQPLPGTADATMPFWSPNGSSVGFFSSGKLKRIEIAGGLPLTLADAAEWGGTWGTQGDIVFGSRGALFRVAENGDKPDLLFERDPSIESYRFPQFLPDGRHFIYLGVSASSDKTGIYAASVQDKTSRFIVRTNFRPLYALGHLFFIRENVLFAQPFDADRLILGMTSTRVVEPVRNRVGVGDVAVGISESGALSYGPGMSGTGGPTHFVWADRRGQLTNVNVGVAGYRTHDLSPDGVRLAAHKHDTSDGGNLWVFDIQRGLGTPITFGRTHDFAPIWAPDGHQVVYASGTSASPLDLYIKDSVGGSNPQLLLKTEDSKRPVDWSKDGRLILYQASTLQAGAAGQRDLWVLPMDGDRKPIPFLTTSADESRARFSPDAKWIAYTSNESGRYEVYLQPFPPTGAMWRLSTNGGAEPYWRSDGRELFYVSNDSPANLAAGPINPTMMAVSIRLDTNPQIGVSQELFEMPKGSGGLGVDSANQYSITPDGQRFLINVPVDQSSASADPAIVVIFNWTSFLKEKQSQ